MTPAKIAGCFALVWSSAYAAAFLAPFVGGALASKIGLRAVMLGFIAFEFLPIAAMYYLPETGPGRRRLEVAVCPADSRRPREPESERYSRPRCVAKWSSPTASELTLYSIPTFALCATQGTRAKRPYPVQR